MTPVIRSAMLTDADDIRHILVGVIELGGLTALTIQGIQPAVIDKIETYRENASFIVAQTDRVIGFQYLNPYPAPSAHVADIATFTDVALRRSGIGRLMMQQTIANARAKGFRKITARIRGDNHNGIPYYERSGFRRVGVYKDHTFVDGTYTDQVLTELIL